MTQAKIHLLPFSQLTRVLRGEVRLVLPTDAQVVGASIVGCDQIGIRVHSLQYPRLREGQLPPVTTATLRSEGLE